jgi:hypothetical protein
LRRLFIRGLAIEQLFSLIASIGARHTPVFERRHGIQTDRRERGDVTGNRQRGLELRLPFRYRCKPIMIVMEQPTTDLLISITPGVRKLVEAAVSLGFDSRSAGLQCGVVRPSLKTWSAAFPGWRNWQTQRTKNS